MNYKGIQWNHLPKILERSVSSAHLAEHLHGKILFRGDQNQNINLNDSRCQWTGMRAGRDGLPCLCTVVRTMNNRLRRDGSVDETSEIPFRWWKVVRNDSKETLRLFCQDRMCAGFVPSTGCFFVKQLIVTVIYFI